MTALLCRRGEVRAALAALLPHAGKSTDDTPDYGRVRFRAGADELVAWTTDGFTSAVTRMTIDEQLDDELDEWDMSVHEVKAVLAVLTRPGNADQQSVWESAECRIDLRGKRVHFAETGDLFGGRDVTVNTLDLVETYPDVPRGLHMGLTAPAPHDPYTNIRTDLLARYVTSAKAYEQVALLRPTDNHSLLITIGHHFTGQLRTLRANPDDARTQETDWADTLKPLRRPLPATPPTDAGDVVLDDAASILRHGAGLLTTDRDTTTLTVIRGGDDT